MKFNPKTILNSTQLSLFIAAVIAVSLIYSTVQSVSKNHELQAQVDNLEDEISVLELENENLQLEIAYYNTDEYLELEARQKFNKANPNESALLLPKDGDGPADEEVASEEVTEEERSNFEQWKFFLFGRHSN